jgi:putative heme-binding domain-containing protein
LGIRHALESRFSERSIAAVDAAWAELGNEDRFVAAAARNLLELQPLELWAERALQTTDAKTGIPAWLALARVAGPCPLHQPNAKPSPYGPKLLERLSQVNYAELTLAQQLGYLRTLQVAWHRHGSAATDTVKSGTAERLNQIYPANNRLANGLLTELLVYFQHPQTASKAVALLKDAPTQEEQIEYARSLRQLKTGWTSSDRQAYFAWFNQAAGYKGGNSLQGFLKLIKADAIALLTDAEKTELTSILEAKPATTAMPVAPPRAFVKKYTLEELVPQVEKGLQKGARDYEKGRKLFAAASCFACHRYDQEGGSNGPDLTGIAGRFNTRDLLESILDPSKEVSDQYAAVEIYTIDGKLITGRIANLNGDNLMINTDMLNPNGMVSVNRKNIEELKPAKNSMMPAGLLDTLTVEEIIDLTAYLVSRGDRSAAMFKK